MARPNWEFIRVDVRLPRHPKLDGLPDATKWKLVELWAHCGEELTDGFVRHQIWQRLLTPRQRVALLDAGLASLVPGGVMMHDYLEHQRSKAEVDELIRTRKASGRKGGRATAKAKQDLQQTLQRLPGPPASKRCSKPPSKTAAEAEAEAEAEQTHTPAEAINSNVEGTQPAIRLPEEPWLNGSRPELPADRPDLEAERRRQMDALMREYPEVTE